MIVRDVKFALRRLLNIKWRAALTIVAFAAGLASLVLTLAKLVSLNAQADDFSSIGGIPVIAAKFSLVSERSIRLNKKRHLSDFADTALKASPIVILEFGSPVKILSVGGAHQDEAKIVFYRNRLSSTKPHGGFPSCSVLQLPSKWQDQKFIILHNKWRCKVVAPPEEVRLFLKNFPGASLLMHLDAMKEVMGSRTEDVAKVWLSKSALAHIVKAEPRFIESMDELEFESAQSTSAKQFGILRSLTSNLTLAMFSSVLLGILIYAQGIHRELREEYILRWAVGFSLGKVTKWLAIDVATQALLILITSSFCAVVFVLTYDSNLIRFVPWHVLIALELSILFFVTLIAFLISVIAYNWNHEIG